MMKNLRTAIFAAAAVGGASLLPAAPALANVQVLCAAEQSVGSQPRRIVNPNTGTAYSLNGQGCAAINIADSGYFLSQGFTTGPLSQSLIYQTGPLPSATTAIQIGTIPAWAVIRDIIISNASFTGNGGPGGVTGGLNVGVNTGSGSTSILSNMACNVNCLVSAKNSYSPGTQPGTSILSSTVFSAAAPLFITPTTGWSGANLTITVLWDYF